MSAFLRVSLRSTSLLRNNVSIYKNQVSNISKTNVQCYKETRVNPFTMAGLFKHYELLPLVGIVVAGMAALGVYSVYFCSTRNDVQFRKRPEYDSMDLLKPPVLKMVTTIDYKEFQPLTELDKIYKEMAEAEEELKKTNGA